MQKNAWWRTRPVLICAGAASVLLLIAVLFLAWANTVMQGERAAALDVWRDDRVRVSDERGAVLMEPTGAATGTGLVFYPGARVDPYAYLATFDEAVAQGATVVIVKPTLNLAFFDATPLDEFEGLAPGVQTWAVGGHSLGGVKACQLVPDASLSGLLLLGSYCATNISTEEISVLSLSGSRDGLSTPDKVAAARDLLPPQAAMVQIDGGNHAAFGFYGDQPGDLSLTAPRAGVDRQISDGITEWLLALLRDSVRPWLYLIKHSPLWG
ncbi:MAG: alpha/beta hydrolase [Mycetocola sp.]